MVGLAEQSLRIFTGLGSVDERRHQIRVKIEPRGVKRLLTLEKNIFFGFFQGVDLIAGEGWRFGGDAVKRATAGDAIDFQPRGDFELEQLQVPEANLLAGRIELRSQQVLRRLNNRVQLFWVVGYTGDAPVRLDPNEHRATVGIGHARKHTHDFTRQFFLALFLSRGSTVFVGADEFEKLPAILLEEKSDFLCLHDSNW